MSKPSPQTLHEHFTYDPDTGVILRKSNGWPAFNNKITGGYLQGLFEYQSLMAHHVAWAMYYGEWPEYNLKHKNRDKTDNSITNLVPGRGSPRRVAGNDGVRIHPPGTPDKFEVIATGERYADEHEAVVRARYAKRMRLQRPPEPPPLPTTRYNPVEHTSAASMRNLFPQQHTSAATVRNDATVEHTSAASMRNECPSALKDVL